MKRQKNVFVVFWFVLFFITGCLSETAKKLENSQDENKIILKRVMQSTENSMEFYFEKNSNIILKKYTLSKEEIVIIKDEKFEGDVFCLQNLTAGKYEVIFSVVFENGEVLKSNSYKFNINDNNNNKTGIKNLEIIKSEGKIDLYFEINNIEQKELYVKETGIIFYDEKGIRIINEIYSEETEVPFLIKGEESKKIKKEYNLKKEYENLFVKIKINGYKESDKIELSTLAEIGEIVNIIKKDDVFKNIIIDKYVYLENENIEIKLENKNELNYKIDVYYAGEKLKSKKDENNNILFNTKAIAGKEEVIFQINDYNAVKREKINILKKEEAEIKVVMDEKIYTGQNFQFEIYAADYIKKEKLDLSVSEDITIIDKTEKGYIINIKEDKETKIEICYDNVIIKEVIIMPQRIEKIKAENINSLLEINKLEVKFELKVSDNKMYRLKKYYTEFGAPDIEMCNAAELITNKILKYDIKAVFKGENVSVIDRFYMEYEEIETKEILKIEINLNEKNI